MDELINQVANRTGISQDQAQQAVSSILDFAKQRLPGPVASQLENALLGGGSMQMPSGASGAFGQQQGQGGMFGGQEQGQGGMYGGQEQGQSGTYGTQGEESGSYGQEQNQGDLYGGQDQS